MKFNILNIIIFLYKKPFYNCLDAIGGGFAEMPVNQGSEWEPVCV